MSIRGGDGTFLSKARCNGPPNFYGQNCDLGRFFQLKEGGTIHVRVPPTLGASRERPGASRSVPRVSRSVPGASRASRERPGSVQEPPGSVQERPGACLWINRSQYFVLLDHKKSILRVSGPLKNNILCLRGNKNRYIVSPNHHFEPMH